MKKNPIIVFFGPDGSGKSTHIRLLSSYLNSLGIKVRSTWIGSHHSLVYLLGKSARKAITKKRYYMNPLVNRPVFLPFLPLNKLGRKLWLCLELLSLIPVIFVKVSLPRFLGYVVIVERYIPATLADLVYALGEFSLNSFIGKLLLRIIRTNTLLVFLDADYVTIANRRGEKTEPRMYINIQRRIYKFLSKLFECLVIDTSQLNMEETQRIIRSYVLIKLRER